MSSEHILSLTGPDSHSIACIAGHGRVSIGPPRPSDGQPDVLVGVDDRIDWSAWEQLNVPAGYPWPRWISYRGNDTGFLEWSISRPIERFTWSPASAVQVDAGRARIQTLSIQLTTETVAIVLPPSTHCQTLELHGDLTLFDAVMGDSVGAPERLCVWPLPAAAADALWLPCFRALSAATGIAVYSEPFRQAFDCTSLMQYSHVKHLRLRGQLCNLEALAGLPALQSLELYCCPNLIGLPSLADLAGLTRFVAADVDEAAGIQLRDQARDLRSTGRAFEKFSVTSLRKQDWFVTEYALPFSRWPTKAAHAAKKSYKDAAEGVATAFSAAEVETAIRRFVRAFNNRAGIDTNDREDIGDAVRLLAAHSPIEISNEFADRWFDEERDF